jgi:hypothetical protein
MMTMLISIQRREIGKFRAGATDPASVCAYQGAAVGRLVSSIEFVFPRHWRYCYDIKG